MADSALDTVKATRLVEKSTTARAKKASIDMFAAERSNALSNCTTGRGRVIGDSLARLTGFQMGHPFLCGAKILAREEMPKQTISVSLW
jgi:hypothetical protein